MFQIRYATEADMQALCKISYINFQSHRFGSAVFPESDPATLQGFKVLNGMKQMANPEMHIVVITDPITDQVVSYARWFIPKVLGLPGHTCNLSEKGAAQAAAAENSLVYAPRPMNEALLFAPKNLLGAARKRYTTERDMVLDFLATLPSHRSRGRGLGTALLEWGIKKSVTLQTRIYLEATPAGLALYLKHGWRLVEELTLDLEMYGAVGKETFTTMMRESVLLTVG